MVFFPNKKMEMLIDAVKAMVNNSFKENFYRKRKKKVINVLTVFFIFHKVMSKLLSEGQDSKVFSLYIDFFKMLVKLYKFKSV